MANFKKVNSEIKKLLDLDLEVVRGEGYVWFDGDEVPSIYVHPVTTETDVMVQIVWNHLIDHLLKLDHS